MLDLAWIGIAIQIMGSLNSLLQIAEKAFDGIADSGAQKKEMVMQAIHAIVEGIDDFVLTPKIWARLEAIFSPVIDLMCSFLFPHKKKEAA